MRKQLNPAAPIHPMSPGYEVTSQDPAQLAGSSIHTVNRFATQIPQKSNCRANFAFHTVTVPCVCCLSYWASEQSCLPVTRNPHGKTNVCSPFSTCQTLLTCVQSSFA